MRQVWFLAVLTAGCSTPLPSQISPPSSLDAPLEFIYDESVDSDVVDSLLLVHDDIEESGRIEASGTSVRFYPDHGWYADATYTASLDGMEPLTFVAPAQWHLVGETPDTCGSNTWDPLVASTIDGKVYVLATGNRTGCILEYSAAGYTARAIGTPSTDSYDRGMLHLADDGSGFVIHTVDDKTELVDLAGGTLALGEEGRTRGALSSTGRGLVARGTDVFAPDRSHLVVRTIDRAPQGGALVVNPEVELAQGDMMEVAVAANDANTRAVAFVRWDATPIAHLHVAITHDDLAWTVHEFRSGDPNALRAIQVAVADDGWTYVTWHEEKIGGQQIWSTAYAVDGRNVPPARIDGSAPVHERRNEQLRSRWGHTGIAWLEKPEENRLGKVGTRIARDGAWGEIEWSTDAVEPYLELDTAIDAKGNFAFTWENGDLGPCAARKVGATWSEFCELPSPGFTAPYASVAVNARGRAYVSVYTGRSIEIAAFD